MKRFLLHSLTILFVFLFATYSINALGFELASTDVTKNEDENITITGTITNTSWPTTFGIKKIEGEFYFDSNFISFVSVTTSSPGVFTVSNSVVSPGKVSIVVETSSANGILTDSLLFSVALKCTGPTSGSDIYYKIISGGITDKDGNKLEPGNATYTTPVTSNKLRAVISKIKSTNNNLRTLTIKDSDNKELTYTPVFNATTTSYSITVPYETPKVTISATADDSAATVAGIGDATLEVGDQTVTLTVTSESGSAKTYTIKITKEEENSNRTKLKSLTIEEYKDFLFNPELYTYTLYIDKPLKDLTFEYEVMIEGSTVEIKNNKNLKDGSIIKIVVTSSDKKNEETYNIRIRDKNATTTVTKEEITKGGRNPYIIIGLSAVSFGILGALIYIIKKEE